jgi:hypothetical protein
VRRRAKAARRGGRRPPGTAFLATLLAGVAFAFLVSAALRATGRGAGQVYRPGDPRPPEGKGAGWKVAVQVLNGCGVEGAADRVVSKLRRREFNVVEVGNAPGFGYREDVVILRKGDLSMARDVAGALGAEDVLIQRNDAEFVNVTVIVGRPHREESLGPF